MMEKTLVSAEELSNLCEMEDLELLFDKEMINSVLNGSSNCCQ